jgi:23S rRNA (uridine2552-2'-O)-methyltransferase
VKRKNPYVRDPRTRQAKLDGYPARSVYKLEEIDRRCQLLHRGQRVLDLGAAPGSWSLYAAERVGTTGLVVAIDIKPILQKFPPQVIAIQADAFDTDNPAWTTYAPFDLVLSDMAPNTSGSKVRDQTLSHELFSRALALACQVSKPRSHFVGKLFMSDEFPAAKACVAKSYRLVRVLRPEGTRQSSSEVFLVGIDKAVEP